MRLPHAHSESCAEHAAPKSGRSRARAPVRHATPKGARGVALSALLRRGRHATLLAPAPVTLARASLEGARDVWVARFVAGPRRARQEREAPCSLGAARGRLRTSCAPWRRPCARQRRAAAARGGGAARGAAPPLRRLARGSSRAAACATRPHVCHAGQQARLLSPGSRKCKIPREPPAPRRRASLQPSRALGHSGPPAAASLKPWVNFSMKK